MTDTTLSAQFIAVVLFGACFFHSFNTEGRRYAYQWFFVGYIFALLLMSLLVVIGLISFNPSFVVFGAAPSVLVMLYPALLYLAYTIAKLFMTETDLRGMMYLMFLLTPALMLMLDVAGVQLQWWAYPTESVSFLNGVPFYVPFAWGVIGAGFMFIVGRIRRIRFRGSGQFFALMIAAPLLDGVMIILIGLIQVVVNLLASIHISLLYVALAIMFLVLPLALALRIPRLETQ